MRESASLAALTAGHRLSGSALIIWSVEIYSRVRCLHSPALTCWNTRQWCAVSGAVKRRCKAKIRPAVSGYGPEANSRSTVKTDLTSAYRAWAAFRFSGWSRSTAVALILTAALRPCRVTARTGADVPPGVQRARHGSCRQRLHRRMRSSTSRSSDRGVRSTGASSAGLRGRT